MTAKDKKTDQNKNLSNPSMGLIGQQQLKNKLSELIPSALKELKASGQRLPNILFHGETGAGKGAVINWLRDNLSEAANQKMPYRVINCSTDNGALLPSELFGIEKSVATGVTKRQGKIAATKDGIMFLDELDKAPLEFINALLIWMERGEYNPVGNDEEPLESRAIVIMAMVGDPLNKYNMSEWNLDFINRFRDIIEIPSLRDNADDIMPLAEFFAQRYLKQYFDDAAYEVEFSSKLQSRLKTYGWPGNVRELENTVEKWVKKTICNMTTATTSKIILCEKLFDENPPFLAKCKPNGNQRGYYYNPPNSLDEFDNITSPAFQTLVLNDLKSRAPKKDKKKIQKRIERSKAKDSGTTLSPEIGPIATNSGSDFKYQQNQNHTPTPIRTST